MTNKRGAFLLAPFAAALSLIACYGTLAAVALLGALGITVTLNNSIWAGAIVAFAWLALLALIPGWRRHRLWRGISLAAAGVVMITFTMTVFYRHAIEIGGFVLLCAGIYLDWRARKRSQCN